MLMNRDQSLVLATCALTLVLSGGCSSNANFGQAGSGGAAATFGSGGSSSPGLILGGTGPGLGTGGGAGVCAGNLADFGCPGDFAAAQRFPSTCTATGYGRAFIGSCNGFSALLLDGALSGSYCF